MGQNKLVQYGAVLLLVVVVLIVISSRQDESISDNDAFAVGGGEALSEEAMAGLGIEGDTEKDIVATLIGEVRNMKEGMTQLRAENTALRADNAKLLGMEQNIGRRMAVKLSEAEKTVASQSEAEFNRMLRRLEEAEKLLQKSHTQRNPALNTASSSIEPLETVWVAPLGQEGDSGGLLNSLNHAGSGLRSKIALDELPGIARRRGSQEIIQPYYTIPRNATLVNSTAMTALVGRVPIGGQVTDPYSFKVIIGRDNLMANGLELPDVAYSIASGKAVGDWTLGCVRGDLFSITFVFDDGMIRTVPKAEDVFEGSASERDIKIGELSDAFGNPCVVGERITNAYTYLTQRMGVVAASAAAEAAAAAQTTQITSVDGSGAGITSFVDGSTADFVLGSTIASGSSEVARWLDERQSQQFDAIYVKPGATVSLHITEQLSIDYDPQGRRTHHAAFAGEIYRALD